jgi:RNA polymerase-binding protein DksA
MNPKQVSAIRKRLNDRTTELRQDILGELQKYDDERYSLLADRVADVGDQSLIHLLSDISLAEVSRDVGEFREIEAALARLDDGTYGICIDCEEKIGLGRLNANPSSARCVNCQTAFERRDRKTHIRTL